VNWKYEIRPDIEGYTATASCRETIGIQYSISFTVSGRSAQEALRRAESKAAALEVVIGSILEGAP
jgi:predicted exporter